MSLIICNGKINSVGMCERCYQVSQSSSGRCNRYVELQSQSIPDDVKKSLGGRITGEGMKTFFEPLLSIPDEQITENISMGKLNFLEKSNLEHRYEKETGKKHWTNPVSHGEYAFPTDDYVNWLMRLINILALQHKKERE